MNKKIKQLITEIRQLTGLNKKNISDNQIIIESLELLKTEIIEEIHHQKLIQEYNQIRNKN